MEAGAGRGGTPAPMPPESQPAAGATMVRRATHASGLHSVERELATLHREMLHLGREDARSVRLSVLSLVAVSADEAGCRTAQATVEHLARTHPARAVIVLPDPAGDDLIEADLDLICAPAAGGQICIEQVRLHLRGRPATHLASAVTPLLVPDVPVYMWLVGAPRLDPALGREAAALRARLLLDSDAYADPRATMAVLEDALDRPDMPVIADIAWARGRRWREHIAQAFEDVNARQFIRHITRVEVECVGEEPSALGWLTGGWLKSRLAGGRQDHPVVAVSATTAPDVRRGELRAVRLFATNQAHRATVAMVRPDTSIQTRIHVDGALTAFRAVPHAPGDLMRLVGSLLEDVPADPVYREAVHVGRALAAGTDPPPSA